LATGKSGVLLSGQTSSPTLLSQLRVPASPPALICADADVDHTGLAVVGVSPGTDRLLVLAHGLLALTNKRIGPPKLEEQQGD
jgi:hypothetical protein